MDILVLKILVASVSLVFLLCYLYNKRMVERESEEKFKQQTSIRALSQTEANILSQYYNIKSVAGMHVYQLSGIGYRHKDQLKPFSHYYTINNVRVTFVGQIIDFINQYNQADVIFVDNKAIVISLNGLTLSILKQYIDHHQRWLKGQVGQYYPLEYYVFNDLKQRDANPQAGREVSSILQSDVTHHFVYTVLSHRQASKREIKQCRRYSWLSGIAAMVFLSASAISVISLAYCDNYQTSCVALGCVAIFMLLSCICYIREAPKIKNKTINLVKGRITDIDRQKNQLTLSHSLKLFYPIYWNEFITLNENNDVILEIMVDSHYIVSYDGQLAINGESQYGRFYPLFNKLIRASLAFILLLFFVFDEATTSLYGLTNLVSIKSPPTQFIYTDVSLNSPYKVLQSLEYNKTIISIKNNSGLCISVSDNPIECRRVLLIRDVQLKHYFADFKQKNAKLINIYQQAINHQLLQIEMNEMGNAVVINHQDTYKLLHQFYYQLTNDLYAKIYDLNEKEIKLGYVSSKAQADDIIKKVIANTLMNKLYNSFSLVADSMIINIDDPQLARTIPLLPNTRDHKIEHFNIDFYQHLITSAQLTMPISVKGIIKNVKKSHFGQSAITLTLSAISEQHMASERVKQQVNYYKLYVISAFKLIFQLFVCYQLLSTIYMVCQNASIAQRVKHRLKKQSH